MESFEIAKILVIEDFVEYAIRVPGRATANEFTVGRSQGIENGVVEFHIVCDKVKFVGVNDVECWAADCFGVYLWCLWGVCKLRRRFFAGFVWFVAKKAPPVRLQCWGE